MPFDGKFNVTIGLCITTADTPKWFDKGLVYSDVPYANLVGIQDLANGYNDEIEKALEPLREELVELGYAAAELGNPEAAQGKTIVKKVKGKGKGGGNPPGVAKP